jgi:6-phosphofructokinase 1
MVGIDNDEIVYVPFNKAIKSEKKLDSNLLSILAMASI